MSYETFVTWLHGFMELANPKTLDEKQVQIIKDHLALVFTKVTPDREKVKEVPEIEIEGKDWSDIYEKWKKKNPNPYNPWPTINPLPWKKGPYSPYEIYCDAGAGIESPKTHFVC